MRTSGIFVTPHINSIATAVKIFFSAVSAVVIHVQVLAATSRVRARTSGLGGHGSWRFFVTNIFVGAILMFFFSAHVNETKTHDILLFSTYTSHIFRVWVAVDFPNLAGFPLRVFCGTRIIIRKGKTWLFWRVPPRLALKFTVRVFFFCTRGTACLRIANDA